VSDRKVYGPEPICLEGRSGSRYWVHHPFPFTGHAEVDDRLAGFPVAVFGPPGRPAHQTPVVLALQGMSAPWHWNAFLVPPLLDMGIACVLFDTPFAGERSLARNHRGDIVSELAPLLERRVRPGAALVPLLVQTVARDFGTVLDLIEQRHGLGDPRRALFGVSLGTLLAAFAFARDGIGERLLGTLGHADLSRFARSYSPFFASLAVSLPGRLLGRLAALWFGPLVRVGIDFLGVLREVAAGGPLCAQASPMTFCERVGPGRRVRFLVGKEDALVRPEDAIACARRFPDGACYVVPGLGHGSSMSGPTFVEHARYFVGTQLGDWQW
jgi:hypothetical protein